MKDDGTGGDALPATAFSARPFPARRRIKSPRFTFPPRTALGGDAFPALRRDNEPVRECVVMFGDGNPGGSFRRVSFVAHPDQRDPLGSLVRFEQRMTTALRLRQPRVIYNMQGRFAGSPYHQGFDTPNGNLCHYKWIFNDDDKFLGATRFQQDSPAGQRRGRRRQPPARATPTPSCARSACRGSTAAMWRCMSTATAAAR
jgi:hypothetical protein